MTTGCWCPLTPKIAVALGDEVFIKADGKKYALPKEDVVLLPTEESSAEELCRYILGKVVDLVKLSLQRQGDRGGGARGAGPERLGQQEAGGEEMKAMPPVGGLDSTVTMACALRQGTAVFAA